MIPALSLIYAGIGNRSFALTLFRLPLVTGAFIGLQVSSPSPNKSSSHQPKGSLTEYSGCYGVIPLLSRSRYYQLAGGVENIELSL
jgi:hypothetical protein